MEPTLYYVFQLGTFLIWEAVPLRNAVLHRTKKYLLFSLRLMLKHFLCSEYSTVVHI